MVEIRPGESFYARRRRTMGDRPAPLSDATEQRWRAFAALCAEAAADPDAEPAAMRLERGELRMMAMPGTATSMFALKALLNQADLYLTAPPRARPHFAAPLKALADQAWRLVGPPPAELRHPSVGRD